MVMSQTTNIVIDDLNKLQADTSNKMYRIILSRDALMLIAHCVEDISRFASGQPELANTLQTMLAVGDDSCQKREEIEDHLFAAKKILYPELSRNASYSYNGGTQRNIPRKELIGNTYQIYRGIYHQVALHEEWNNVYSSETLPSGTLESIKIELIK